MESKMRKLIFIFAVNILLLLVSCSSPDDQIPEQQIGIVLSDENTELNIVNINEAFEMFSIPENISREIHVGDYVKDFPVELQDILVYCNDDIKDENDNVWQKYEADCDVITPETAGDVPYEDIVSAINTFYGASILNMQIVDIDGDGEDEYAAGFTDMKFSGLLFAKEIDGQWVIIGGDGDYTNSTKLLDFENTYYLLTENELSYWNNEIDMPDLSYWDNYGTIRHDDYWHQIGLNITVTDYTPFEVYSHEGSSSIDYLANINWETLQADNAKTIDVQPSIWHDESYNHSFALCNSWEQSYEENCYLYVTASILEQYDKLGEHDKMLAILQQTEAGTWEIIKVYYLSANYDICFTPTGDTEMPDTQSEALSVNEVQEDDTYYTMEDIKALDIPEDMVAYWMVLNSKMPFVSYNEGKQEFYWDEYHWILGEPVHFLGIPEKNIYWGDPRSFTIVDMNNDGKNEMVIYLEFGIAQILYYEDGVVYGYQFTERGMSPIYSNGIYEGFISAEHCDYHRLTELNKDGFTEEKIAEAIYSSSGDNYYEIGGISVSQEEFEEFKQSLADAGEAECIDYTEDLLDEHLLGGLSEEEWRMIKHVAVVPMTDMMEYVMETEMMQAYYEVLTGEKEFISVMDDNQLFNIVSYQDRNENDRGEDEILYFSIVDIDRNGTYEVILTDSETNILYYKDGDVYCYRYNFYEIGALSNSGIFSIDNLYYERIDGKFGIINSINEDGCDIEEVDYNGNINDDRIRYYYFSEEMIEQYFR